MSDDENRLDSDNVKQDTLQDLSAVPEINCNINLDRELMGHMQVIYEPDSQEDSDMKRIYFDKMFDLFLMDSLIDKISHYFWSIYLYEQNSIWFLDNWARYLGSIPMPEDIIELNGNNVRYSNIFRKLSPSMGMLKEHSMREVADIFAKKVGIYQRRANSVFADILESEAKLPTDITSITSEDLEVSVHNWIKSVGVIHNSSWWASLPDGRKVCWNATNPDVMVDGSPDRLAVVLRQWVEEPYGESPYQFADEVLNIHPRWKRTLSKLRERDKLFMRDEIELALKLDALPHSPSVVTYALAQLGQGEKVPPCRGGLVTTCLINIVFDPDHPDWKDHFETSSYEETEKHDPLIMPLYDYIQEICKEELEIDSPLRKFEEREEKAFLKWQESTAISHKYRRNILQSITASCNWTTQEFWRKANTYCSSHRKFMEIYFDAISDLNEGFIPKGANKKDDLISKEGYGF